MKWIIPIFFIFFHKQIHAQIIRHTVSSSFLGASAYSNNHADVFALTVNQAALAKLKHKAVGIYGEKRFLMKELNLYYALFVLPTKLGNFSLASRYYGFIDYNETEFGLAYARSLGSKLDIGAQFNYFGVRASGYGNSAVPNFELGVIMHLTEKLNAGIHIYNPVGGKFGKNREEKLSSIYSFGIGYDASKLFFAGIEVEKKEDYPVNVHASVLYRIIPQVQVRAGIATQTASMHVGIAYILNALRLEFIVQFHPVLGMSPGVLILHNFNKIEY